MRLHRAIWTIAILCVLAAVALSSLPNTARRVTDGGQEQGAEQDALELGRKMIAALEADPRVRRTSTQRLVESVAALAEEGHDERPEVQYAIGLLKFYGEEDYSAAEAAFRRAIELDPAWAWGHNGLAIVLYASGRVEAAEAAWDRAMERAPDWVRPYNDRAIQYRRAGRIDEAGEQLRRALALSPMDATTHYNYGVWLDVTGDHDLARAEYETALEIDPRMPAALYNLACSYAREGRIEKAAPYLEDAIAMNAAFREEAMRDPDFDRVRDNVLFDAVVGGDD